MTETHKQVIVMRKDLNMRKGKMVAQGAHSSLGALLDMEDTCISKVFTGRGKFLLIPLDENTYPWLYGKFTKVCVGIDGDDPKEVEAQLRAIHEQAKAAGLPTSLITDAGLTEFNGVPTLTCCSVGPGKNEDIDKITGGLKLL